jgi:hypothetical protein
MPKFDSGQSPADKAFSEIDGFGFILLKNSVFEEVENISAVIKIYIFSDTRGH